MSYFLESSDHSNIEINVNLNLSNYAIKSNLFKRDSCQ